MTDRPNAQSDSNDFEFAALRGAVNYRKSLVSEFAPMLRGAVIEVGCGIGQMTAHFRSLPTIDRLLSIEPEPSYCEAHRIALPGHELIQGTIEQAPASEWNAIVSINVLEHIEDDEEELARYCKLLTNDSGFLCLFVPARPELYAPIDRDFGHFRRYTRQSLQAKLTSAGFRVRRLNYFNSAGYFAWWFNFCILKKRTFEVEKVRFYDRAIFPLIHLAETKLMRPPFGQSLIAIAQA